MSIEKFTAYNPTCLYFGEGVTDDLGKQTKKYGNKVLLVTGKGSVKKYGYFDKVVGQLRNAGLEIVEFSGIKPNPVIEDVREASELGRNENVDVIVALGGGSAVDSAKIISLSIASGYDGWDIMKGRAKPESAIPLICVLTLAATGTVRAYRRHVERPRCVLHCAGNAPVAKVPAWMSRNQRCEILKPRTTCLRRVSNWPAS